MHPEILTKEQQQLLPLVKAFRRSFYMAGGTAIALHIGHRQSIDFDLFTHSAFNKKAIYEKLSKFPFKRTLIYEESNQLHFLINKVKLTFFQYPFSIKATHEFNGVIKIPRLIDLASMKTLALGGRAKWKDYVDMYFLLKNYFSLKEISLNATKLFTEGAFNSKLLLEQLAYFNDINYEEEVIYMPGFKVSDNEVKKYLTDIALQ